MTPTEYRAVGFQPDRLRAARLAADLSQRELAEGIGVAQSHVSRYETGVMRPDLDVLPKLARALGVTTDYLLGVS